MNRRPDTMLVLVAVFVVGMAATLLLPIASSETNAAPASPLQAGIILD
ncbi:MAG: hypothetical protein ABR612_05030 [Chromatocurvus sp.]